jgi:hypothetical protein
MGTNIEEGMIFISEKIKMALKNRHEDENKR